MLVINLAVNALVLLLACVGMMVVFLGGGGYLPALLLILALAIPVSLASVLWSLVWFLRRVPWRELAGEIWHSLPGGLIAALALVVALIVCGELALYVTLVLAEQPPRLWQHLPLIAGLFAALAFALLEAMRRARKNNPA